MTPADFINNFVVQLREKAAHLRAYGAANVAQTCEQIASDLEAELRGWWLAELTIADAAQESGYSQERLRQMARDGELPHQKGAGVRGQLIVSRCDLPRRPKPRPAGATLLEERLLRPRHSDLRKPA